MAEVVSVILQVGYFKLTKRMYGEGRRIFKMTPLHHHFELLGWSEMQVKERFWLIGLLSGMLGVALALVCQVEPRRYSKVMLVRMMRVPKMRGMRLSLGSRHALPWEHRKATPQPNVVLVDELMIDGRHGILPQLRLSHPGTQASRDGAQVAVRQLVPRLGKCQPVLFRVRQETFGDGPLHVGIRIDKVHLYEVRQLKNDISLVKGNDIVQGNFVARGL